MLALYVPGMGQNSKAKRDAKAKARRRAQRAGPVLHVHYADDDVVKAASSEHDLARLFRRACSECGSSDLEWMTPAELADSGDEARRTRVGEIRAFLGGGSDAWMCRQCGNFGIL